MAYSFDGVSRIITITAQTVVSVRDIYSRWVDWLALSDNAKFLPAFDTVGGNDIDASAGTAIPIYAFLRNGWKVKPQEASHTLSVTDGVLLVDGGGDPFVNTLGNFVVRVNYQQPVQAIGFNSGGGGGISAAQVWQHIVENGKSAEDILRLIVSHAAGAATGLESGSPQFKSLDGTKTRIDGTYANGDRAITALDTSA